MNAQELKDFYAMQEDEAKRNPVERGKYLVNSFGCAFCHTPFREDESMVEEMRFAGGQRWNLYPFAELVSYNLTSDKETGLGNWKDDQIKMVLTKGIRRDGSRMLPFPMPWPAYASLKDEDLNAIIAYLRTLPPISNKIPDPQQLNFFSYLWGKFQVLILKKDIPGYVYPGNAGTPKEKTMSSNSVGQSAKEEAR
jgi:mono/diheme cytochrome c family protein